MFRIVLLALLLSACATPVTTPTVSTAALQQKVLLVEVAYEAPLAVAVAYNNRPRCATPRTVVTCSEPSVVAELRKANHAVMAAFAVAMTVASTPGVSEGDVSAKLSLAVSAIGQFQSVIDAYNK